jgi:hypothetical protein
LRRIAYATFAESPTSAVLLRIDRLSAGTLAMSLSSTSVNGNALRLHAVVLRDA